jgi:hypothetical protein
MSYLILGNEGKDRGNIFTSMKAARLFLKEATILYTANYWLSM